MKLIEKYNSWNLKQKNLFWLGFIGLAGTIILLPFCLLSNPGLMIGFVLGTLIEVVCYLLILFTSEVLVKTSKGEGNTSLTVLSSFGFFIRFLLYAGGLVLGAFATFVWRVNWLSIWTIFAGYMPMPIILAINTFKEKK